MKKILLGKFTNFIDNSKGAVIIEFALCLPILLTFLYLSYEVTTAYLLRARLHLTAHVVAQTLAIKNASHGGPCSATVTDILSTVVPQTLSRYYRAKKSACTVIVAGVDRASGTDSPNWLAQLVVDTSGNVSISQLMSPSMSMFSYAPNPITLPLTMPVYIVNVAYDYTPIFKIPGLPINRNITCGAVSVPQAQDLGPNC